MDNRLGSEAAIGAAGSWPAELVAALARARIEVDLDVLTANLAAVRRFVRPGTRVLAVVKGDAYGLGAEVAARALVAAGADGIGTDTLESALRLRRAGIPGPIMVFQPVEGGLAPHWVRAGLTATVHDMASLRALARAAEAVGGADVGPGPDAGGAAARVRPMLGAAVVEASGAELPGTPRPGAAVEPAQADPRAAVSPPTVDAPGASPETGSCSVCPVHLEVDMGFGRGGFRPGEVAAALAAARDLPGIRIEGLYTHLPTAVRPRLALRLLDRFLRLVEELERAGLRPPVVHCAESHLLVLAPDAQLDLVRVGNLLYGYAPRAARRAGLDVRRPSRLLVRVRSVHPCGALAPGYRGAWARRGAPVAVLPVGLADGLRPGREPRFWQDRLLVLGRRLLDALGRGRLAGLAGLPPGPRLRMHGREVPLRGEFMMNHCLIDASGLDLQPGSEVELVVGRLTAPAHLPVVYRHGGRPVAVAWPGRQVLDVAPGGWGETEGDGASATAASPGTIPAHGSGMGPGHGGSGRETVG
ncbi:MAG TPA: alanine racemase [Thermaerobacter sp.]